MGAGAGLPSSACVGPIVVSILIAIASSTVNITFGVALSAVTKMLLFGMGVGMPVLLLGVISLTLPKGGKWMKYIQWIFAILIGYFAYGYLQKGLLGLGLSEKQGLYFFAGAILLFLSVFQMQPSDRASQHKGRIALFTLAGVMGFFLIWLNLIPHSPGSIIQGQPLSAPD